MSKETRPPASVTRKTESIKEKKTDSRTLSRAKHSADTATKKQHLLSRQAGASSSNAPATLPQSTPLQPTTASSHQGTETPPAPKDYTMIAMNLETRLMTYRITSGDKKSSLVLYNELGDRMLNELPAPGTTTAFFKTPMDRIHFISFCNHMQLGRGSPRPTEIIHYHAQGMKCPAFMQGRDVLLMNANNAPGSEKFKMGEHGFVWIFSKDGGPYLHGQKVHIFTQSDMEKRPERVWYKGMYKVHRTQVFLPASAWLQLPAKTRETAADIRVSITTDTTEGESFKCEYDRFVRGENTAELMLLEYCGVPPGRGFFDAMDAVISGRLFPVRKMQR